MLMARTQTLVQLTPELLEELDAYRGRTGAASRSEVIRDAIARLLAEDREAQIDAQIVAAYERQPPEDIWSEAFARSLVEAEPWD
jgi:metal-responsive CopG/Arc/MetJ family transcriptional regulator